MPAKAHAKVSKPPLRSTLKSKLKGSKTGAVAANTVLFLEISKKIYNIGKL